MGKLLKQIVTFTLDIWNDPNAVYHGTFLDQSKQVLIAHVHHSVRREYALHASDTEPFMVVHFHKPLDETLQRSLLSMRNWLERAEGSRRTQSAKTKIAQIDVKRQYVDATAIMSLSSRNLRKWIHKPFQPSVDSQTTLYRLILSTKKLVSTPFFLSFCKLLCYCPKEFLGVCTIRAH